MPSQQIILWKRALCSKYIRMYTHIYKQIFSKTQSLTLALQTRILDWRLSRFGKELFIYRRILYIYMRTRTHIHTHAYKHTRSVSFGSRFVWPLVVCRYDTPDTSEYTYGIPQQYTGVCVVSGSTIRSRCYCYFISYADRVYSVMLACIQCGASNGMTLYRVQCQH